MLGKKVLIIEDEPEIATIVSQYLQVQGYSTDIADTISSCNAYLEREAPDFIILDLTLPDGDGIELCRRLRANMLTPILVLSARSSDTDKVLALGFGADDYMTKPFSLSELAARIQAHLRRLNGIEAAALKQANNGSTGQPGAPAAGDVKPLPQLQQPSLTSANAMQTGADADATAWPAPLAQSDREPGLPLSAPASTGQTRAKQPLTAQIATEQTIICAGELTIDKRSRKVKLNNQLITLSAKEFDLLYFLASNPEQVFTKTQLLDQVWGFSSYVDDNTVTVYIGRLRSKLEPHAAKSSYIKTVWGVGYQFSPDDEKEQL